MPLVTLAALASYLREDALATGSQAGLLQEHLDAAIEVVTAHVGEHGALTVRVSTSSRSLVLPVTHVTSLVAVRDPLGTTVTPSPGQSNLLAGVVVVPTARPGVWEVDVVTRDAAAATVLATKIIAQHLWSTRRGSAGGSSRNNPALGRSGGDDDVVTTGLGYAIPRRAAQLLAISAVPALA